jgi:hypothetical protein
MELTKEHFEAHLKKQLSSQTAELKAYAREQTEELPRIVSAGFEDLQHRLDLSEIVQAHERKLKKIEEALHITL